MKNCLDRGELYRKVRKYKRLNTFLDELEYDPSIT